ncbi:hypothetical protein D3C80_2227840 [compost metagenome]
MTQELMSKAHTLACPFNQTRKIRHNEAAAVTRCNHTQVRGNRSKVIRTNLWLSCRNY